MFGLERIRKDYLAPELVNFLNRVDAVYMKAFAIKSTKDLQAYVSRTCAIKINQVVCVLAGRYFGADKFRETRWVKIEEVAGKIRVKKEVRFSRIRVGGSLQMHIAENYDEEWIISTKDNTYQVVSIRGVELL